MGIRSLICMLVFSFPIHSFAVEPRRVITADGTSYWIDPQTHQARSDSEFNQTLQVLPAPLPPQAPSHAPLSNLQVPLPPAPPHPVLSCGSNSQANTQAMLDSTSVGLGANAGYAPTMPLGAAQSAFVMTCVNNLFGPGVPVNDYSAIRNEADQHDANALRLAEETERLKHYQGITVERLQVVIPEGYQRPSQERRIIDVSSIPDPDDSEIPYQFQSQGEAQGELKRLYKHLYKIQPEFVKRKKAKELGIASVEEADQSFHEGDIEQGHFYRQLAEGFLDLAIGLDPVTGMGRSSYELLFGRNFVTGARLGTVDRSLAFLGVVTFGGSRTAAQAGRGMWKIFSRASHLLQDRQAAQAALREGEVLAGRAGRLLEGWKKNHRITNIHTAEHVNQTRFSQYVETPPFQLGSHVVELVTTRPSDWIRVHGPPNQIGDWVVRKSAIRGLTAEEIKIKLALTRTPTHISDVHIPWETRMFRGNIQNHGQGSEGAIQYFIDHGFTSTPREWFTNMRSLL